MAQGRTLACCLLPLAYSHTLLTSPSPHTSHTSHPPHTSDSRFPIPDSLNHHLFVTSGC
ncbi:hypothetical protein [Moorena sp. SIO2C4]|uniref:hypothetical protein n=1 Tax=Moorena sp. SIO2C4 TaxID=2607824 RepID=UPI0013C69D8E|nr:hypothetical protein [Moorena sp. SIO2C4]NES45637.1 hypothetical protein [Moorena sp. SIO2C4]